MRETFVTTPDGRVAVADYGGRGPDVLLLHGSGRTLADWGLVVPLLHGRRVVAMDFRWHGLSEDRGDVGLSPLADDIEAVVAALGLVAPVVAGHSLGGMAAAVYATRHAECPGAINLDGHGRGDRDDFPGIDDDTYNAFQAQVDEIIATQAAQPRSGDDAWRDEVIRTRRSAAIAMNWKLSARLVEEINARSIRHDDRGTWRLRPGPEYGEAIAAALEGIKLFDIYRARQCPLLVYQCTKYISMPDPAMNHVLDERQRHLTERLSALSDGQPAMRTRTVDAGHMVVFERPEMVAEDILAFQG
jgi:pimeloyl-ACP methyl ester carboxylesterase